MMNEQHAAWDYIKGFLELRKRVSISTNVFALYVYLLQASESANDGIDNTDFSLLCDPLMASLGINKRTFLSARNQLHQLGVINYQAGDKRAYSPKYTIMPQILWCKNAPKTAPKTAPKNVPSNNSNTIVNFSTIESNITNGCKNAPKNVPKTAPKNFEGEKLPTAHIPPTETTLYYALNNQDKLIAGAQKMHYATASTNGVDELVSLIADYCRWYCGTYNTGMANANTSPTKAWTGFEEWILKNPDRAIHQGFLEYLAAKYQGKDIARAIEAAKLDAEAKATQIANWQAWIEKFVFGQFPTKNNSPVVTTNSNKLKRATPTNGQ